MACTPRHIWGVRVGVHGARVGYVRGVAEDLVDGDVGEVLACDLVLVRGELVGQHAQTLRLIPAKNGNNARLTVREDAMRRR